MNRKVGETCSWLIESNNTISLLKKKLKNINVPDKPLETVPVLQKENKIVQEKKISDLPRIGPASKFSKRSRLEFQKLETKPVNRIQSVHVGKRSTDKFQIIN
jgi:hypothetical protein